MRRPPPNRGQAQPVPAGHGGRPARGCGRRQHARLRDHRGDDGWVAAGGRGRRASWHGPLPICILLDVEDNPRWGRVGTRAPPFPPPCFCPCALPSSVPPRPFVKCSRPFFVASWPLLVGTCTRCSSVRTQCKSPLLAQGRSREVRMPVLSAPVFALLIAASLPAHACVCVCTHVCRCWQGTEWVRVTKFISLSLELVGENMLLVIFVMPQCLWSCASCSCWCVQRACAAWRSLRRRSARARPALSAATCVMSGPQSCQVRSAWCRDHQRC